MFGVGENILRTTKRTNYIFVQIYMRFYQGLCSISGTFSLASLQKANSFLMNILTIKGDGKSACDSRGTQLPSACWFPHRIRNSGVSIFAKVTPLPHPPPTTCPPTTFSPTPSQHLTIIVFCRSVFLQYVERKVFRITEPIAEELFKDTPIGPEISAFKFAIIEKMDEPVHYPFPPPPPINTAIS